MPASTYIQESYIFFKSNSQQDFHSAFFQPICFYVLVHTTSMKSDLSKMFSGDCAALLSQRPQTRWSLTWKLGAFLCLLFVHTLVVLCTNSQQAGKHVTNLTRYDQNFNWKDPINIFHYCLANSTLCFISL